jgi:DNA-binding GntR family transcriptional regulator
MDVTSRSPLSGDGSTVQPRVRRIPSLKEAAAEEIRRRVFAAELPPGSKIDQEGLARQLGISRVPVREALITLHDEGIVENVARRGAFVAPLSREDVHDHYRLVGVVSGLAAERAAEHLTVVELDRLRTIASEMEACASADEEEHLNFEFHRLINRAAHSRRLLLVLGMLINAVPSTFYESHSDWSAQAHQDHRVVIDALAARDGGRARRVIETHFASAADRAVMYLEARNFWDAAEGYSVTHNI